MSFFCQSFLFLSNVNISHTLTYPQINYLSHLPFTHRQTYISSQMHARFHMYVHTPCAGSQLEAVRVCVLPAGDDVITSEQWGRPAYKHRKWCPDRRPADTHTHTHITPVTQLYYIHKDWCFYNNSLIQIELNCLYAPMQKLLVKTFWKTAFKLILLSLECQCSPELDCEDSDGEILHIHNTKLQYEAFSVALRTP